MKPPPIKPAHDDFADKRRRQAAWQKHCEERQMSVAQRNRAASLIRPDAVIKVLGWPEL